MKIEQIVAASIVFAASAIGAVVVCAEPVTDTTGTGAVQSAADQGLGKLDKKTMGATIRASQLIGTNLKNSKGDSVGEIKDLVIDGTGKVRYAAVTYGGFLGVGSKLFAVPFQAFRVSQNPNDPNDRGDYVLTLDVTKEQLSGAEGFDNDRWPNFADTKFTRDLYRRYKLEHNPANAGARSTQQ